MSLSIPIIAEPLFECAKLVVVQGYVPGADIAIYAVPKDETIDAAVLIGQGKSFSASGEIFAVDESQIKVGVRLYATQTMLQDDGSSLTSAVPTDDTYFVTVQKVISLPTPHLFEPLYECSRCVRVEGILPGADVEVTATKIDTQEQNVIGKTPTFGTGTDVSVSPPLQNNVSIQADQWSCSEENKSHPSQSVAVEPIAREDKSFLPNPTIREPIYPCQQYVQVTDCRPGADIELFINNQPTSTILPCATTNSIAIWINQQLQQGDKLTVRQSLCEGSIVSAQMTELVPVTVVSSSLLPIPVIRKPLYEGDTSIELGLTVAGETISIDRNGSQIGMGGADGQEAMLSIEPLKENDKIIATVTLCDGSKISRPVFVKALPKEILAPTVNPNLFACTRVVVVENCIEGATVRIFAQKRDGSENMLIGQKKTYAPSVTINCVAFLESDWNIFATQTVGGKESKPSDSLSVREVPNLPQITVHKKVYTCTHCLLIEQATIGARIDVYQSDRWIGGAQALTPEVLVDVYPPLKKNLPIIVRERLCDEKTAVTIQVDSDVPIKIPRIVAAEPNQQFITVGNLIPGAIVEVKEVGRSHGVIGKASVGKTVADIPLNITLSVGTQLKVQQTLCDASSYTRTYRVGYPKDWPLKSGPFGVSSLEVTDIPFDTNIASQAADHADVIPFLKNGNKAVIHFPSAHPDSGIVANGSPFPLIAFAHAKNANADPALIEPELQQDYHQLDTILKHLASWGFICISPSVFWISFSGDAREFALSDAIQYMLKKNETDTIFRRKIDTNKIGVMGHSSGGAGALHFTTNKNGGTPLGSMVKATALIAPAVGINNRTDSRAVTPRPLLILDGTEDIGGHGAFGDPHPLYNSARKPRIYVSITGANHFGYTESMSDPDNGNPARTMDREDQKTIGKAYITSFFRFYLQNITEVEKYLLAYPVESLENFTIDVTPDIF